MVEILEGSKRSVKRVRYVINILLHLFIEKYGDILLVLCISTRLRLVTILSLLVKYLVILHADPCTDEERKARLKKMVDTTQLRLVLESEDETRARLEYLSDNPIYIPNNLYLILIVAF